MIDLSDSMRSHDIKPNRKEAAISANEEIVRVKRHSYPNDKVGVIGFQTAAKVLLQPTYPSDISNLSKKIDDTGLQGGTDFTAPLELAYSYFSGKPVTSGKGWITDILSNIFVESEPEKHLQASKENSMMTKRIILLTDGEHLSPTSPIAVARKLKALGVTIDCIGIGGSPKAVGEKLLKQIASINPDGSIRYCFIGDKERLLRKYQTLAHHIRAI